MPTRQLTHFRNIGDIFWREVFFNIPRGFRVPWFLVAQSYLANQLPNNHIQKILQYAGTGQFQNTASKT